MELHHYLLNLRERWRSGLVAALIVVLAVAGLTALQSPVYRATSQVFVQARTGNGVEDLNSGASFASQQIMSYAELATTPYVLDEVIGDLDLEITPARLAKDVRVSVEEGSFLIRISASASDPEMAARIADSTAENLQEAVASLSPASTANSVELRIVADAVVPETPTSPNIVRNALLGIVLALLAGIGTALVRSLLNTRVRTIEDLQGGTDRIVLGAIPASRSGEDASRILVQNPYSVASESYRELRTNLQFVKLVENRRSVLVTSSLPGEGKSTATVNLAHVLAMSGARVLLVDADLRSPSVHRILGLEGDAGLTTVLIGQAQLEEVTQFAGIDGLDVITSGAIPPNPSELLGSPAMEDLLEQASNHYDVVLVDAPPLLAVTDAAVLSQAVGGVLVVAQSDRVRRAEFERALAKLETVDANVVGLVLNRVRGVSGSVYAYGSPEARAVLAAEAEDREAAARAEAEDGASDPSADGSRPHADGTGTEEHASFGDVLADTDAQEEGTFPQAETAAEEEQAGPGAASPRRPGRRKAVRRPVSGRQAEIDRDRELESLGGPHGEH
ncbi:polysaccharide biosynthesis tyrosine autokinase [Brachybacterium paraconglomeratum]|uniref:polysaccharide biosynthesis tyrosine autokinase n=1 Tax=Brachybacterium paraconglomeratum TaxID=173362 RepID=UPI003FD39FCF